MNRNLKVSNGAIFLLTLPTLLLSLVCSQLGSFFLTLALDPMDNAPGRRRGLVFLTRSFSPAPGSLPFLLGCFIIPVSTGGEES
jgi:hypothetical protein